MEGYYAGPDVHNVDRLAFTDAFLARLPALPHMRVGHYERVVPPGYAETALNAVPSTDIAVFRPLLSDVVLATRAPLFAGGRAGARSGDCFPGIISRSMKRICMVPMHPVEGMAQ